MKLVDLKPRWMDRDGQHVGLMLQCPHCIAAGLKPPAEGESFHSSKHITMLTCYFQPTPRREQFKLMQSIGEALDEDGWPGVHIVPCNPKQKWSIASGSTFADLSLTPSLDASAAGHWHGFITNGEIK